MAEENGTRLYIVFSGTPYKMGRFIRFFTHGEFNHVSLAFDPSLPELFSFARLQLETPFCGGFVHEGAERYRMKKRAAKIAVCAVDAGREGVARVRERIGHMRAEQDRYLYNMLSAALVPCKKKVAVRDAYTCVEFIAEMLALAGCPPRRPVYSAEQLYRLMKEQEIFRGEFPEGTPTVDETYTEHVPFFRGLRLSVKQFRRMLKNRVRRREKKKAAPPHA